MKRLFNFLVVAVILMLPASGWSAYIDHGDWAVGSNWDIGHVPVPADGTLYVGPAADGTYNVTVSTAMPQVQNNTYFGNINLQVTGVLDIQSGDVTAGNYRPTTINVSANGFLRVGPDRFYLGAVYTTNINVSDDASMRTYWPYLYDNVFGYGSSQQINLSDNAVWQTDGVWFPDASGGGSLFPTAGGSYHIAMSGNAQFQILKNTWTAANAQAAIDCGFFTGSGLQVSQNEWYTIVSVPEPVTMMLLCVGSVLMVRCKRA